MRKCVVVINPVAGHAAGKKYEQPLKAALLENFDDVLVKYTEQDGDATRFVAEAVEQGADTYFVVGGDGTINEAINGLARLANPLQFGFLPLGTANDLARALKIPLDPAKAIAAYKHFHQQQIDIAKINDEYFMNVTAIGTIPEALTHTKTEAKTRFGFLAYVRDGLNALLKSKNQQYDIIIDGQEKHLTTNLIIIALTNSVGSFENMIADAKVDDGKLHFMALKSGNIWQGGGEIMRQLLQGDASKADNVVYATAGSVEIHQAPGSTHIIETNVDGDPGPKLPIKIAVVPRKITVIVPDSSQH